MKNQSNLNITKDIFLCLLLLYGYAAKGQITHNNVVHIDMEYQSSKDIISIFQDANGLIWIENTKGFVSYDGYRLESFPIKQDIHTQRKLPHPLKDNKTTFVQNSEPGVPSIDFEDRQMNQWHLSSHCILKNRKAIPTENIQAFFKQCLSNLKFNCHFQSSDNVIWVGTNQGLLKIASNSPKNHSVKAKPVFLTSVQHGDSSDEERVRPLKTQETRRIFSKSGSLHLNFALADYNNPTNNSFEYKIKGLDEEWFSNGQQNSISYNDLSPGEYEIEIRGKPDDGSWSRSHFPSIS